MTTSKIDIAAARIRALQNAGDGIDSTTLIAILAELTDEDVTPIASAEPEIILPEIFTPVSKGLPNHNRPVLAIRKSSYCTCEFEIITARYEQRYDPSFAWRNIGNDSVRDDGSEVLGWAEMNDWIKPRL